MPEYVYCEDCGEEAAINIGSNGTVEHPFEWECTACFWTFYSNDETPET